MNDCERYIDILAKADGAASEEGAWALSHAARCPACGALAASFVAFEERASRSDAAPPDFAFRVVRAWRSERRSAKLPAPRVMSTPAAVFAAAGFAVAAVVVGVMTWLIWTDPSAVSTSLTSVTDALAGQLVLPARDYANILGAVAAAASALGAVGYYYLVPRR